MDSGSVKLDVLCSGCVKFSDKFVEAVREAYFEPLKVRSFLRYGSLSTLHENAQNDCHLCSIVLEQLERCCSEDGLTLDLALCPAQIEMSISYWSLRDQGYQGVEDTYAIGYAFRGSDSLSIVWQSTYTLSAIKIMSSETKDRLLRMRNATLSCLIKQTCSDPTIDWLRRCLNQCKEIHEECATVLIDEQVPQNNVLRDIGTQGSSSLFRKNISEEILTREDEGWYNESQTHVSRRFGLPITITKGSSKSGKAPLKPSQFSPTRLIDVNDPWRKAGATPDVVQVIDGSLRGQVDYVCLSYRWGVKPFFRLISANALEMESGIDLRKLPQLFRDVVDIVRKLGFRYLWIDALCILQGENNEPDKADFAREAPLMASIYQHCTLTIAAVDASNPNESLFSTRQPLRYIDMYLPNTPCYVPASCPLRSVERANVTSPLETRGWVFQELGLSPRTIIIGKQAVCFSCRESGACEMCCPETPRKGHRCEQKDLLIKLRYRRHGGKHAALHWYKLIRAYSKTQLTRPEDKLVALAGVGLVAQTILQSPSCYGILLNSLRQSLAWHILRADLKNANSGRIRIGIPTWSWASMKGVEILHVMSMFDDEKDTFLPHARLVSGPRPRSFAATSEDNRSSMDHALVLEGAYGSGVYLPNSPLLEGVAKYYPDMEIAENTMIHYIALGCIEERAPAVPFKFGGETAKPAIPKRHGMKTFGLMLQKLEGTDNTFERVGLYEMAVPVNWPKLHRLPSTAMFSRQVTNRAQVIIV